MVGAAAVAEYEPAPKAQILYWNIILRSMHYLMIDWGEEIKSLIGTRSTGDDSSHLEFFQHQHGVQIEAPASWFTSGQKLDKK